MIGPRSCYDEGKRIAECMVMEYHRCFDIDTRIARIFNTYGPNMRKDDGRVVSNFINQCLEGRDISIYGNGSQTRSFCYVDDTVDGLFKLMQSNINTPVNIGNPSEYTVLQLANIIKEMTGSNSLIDIQEDNLPMDDPKKRKPDITKAKTFLGWEPKVELMSGLLMTIN